MDDDFFEAAEVGDPVLNAAGPFRGAVDVEALPRHVADRFGAAAVAMYRPLASLGDRIVKLRHFVQLNADAVGLVFDVEFSPNDEAADQRGRVLREAEVGAIKSRSACR